ncbi:MAG TPA: DUF5684 domain-containing protein [Phycisphaerae bacterium]|nr:DUF5684 domain-containing protein [Phycisphaerae bacterium]
MLAQVTYSAEYETAGKIGAGLLAVVVIIALAVAVFMIAAMWKVFAKAGKPGWAAIIPIYNIIVLLEVAGKPIWWIVLFLLGAIPMVGPIISLVVSILVYIAVAQNFGKSAGFGVGMALLPIVFVPILGFGSATYVGAGGAQPPAAVPPVQPPPPAAPPQA